MESVITHTSDAVMISKVDQEGVKIVFVNEAFTSMTGFTLSEISGRRPPILRGEETDPEELARFEFAIKNWKPYKTETLNYKKNGEPFWIDINMVPVVQSDGSYSHWVSIERDITDRKNQIIAIEEQNEQLKEIAWTQSHIVRAPLSRMMGIINLFDEGIVHESEVKEFLHYLKQSGIELDEIIRDIVKKTERADDDYLSMKTKK
jgi:PAS domain S-box-containing protein